MIEISDSSLRYVSTEKMQVHAAAGIPEYCILDLHNRSLLVRRDPQTQQELYLQLSTHPESELISPLLLPDASIGIAEMLPTATTSEGGPPSN